MGPRAGPAASEHNLDRRPERRHLWLRREPQQHRQRRRPNDLHYSREPRRGVERAVPGLGWRVHGRRGHRERDLHRYERRHPPELHDRVRELHRTNGGAVTAVNGAVNAGSTFTGGIGSTGWTIDGAIAALKNGGYLAL